MSTVRSEVPGPVEARGAADAPTKRRIVPHKILQLWSAWASIAARIAAPVTRPAAPEHESEFARQGSPLDGVEPEVRRLEPAARSTRARRAVWTLAALTAAALVWAAVFVPLAELRPFNEVDWADVLGELGIAVLGVGWIVAVNRVAMPRPLFLLFAVGAVMLVVGATQDVLDELMVCDEIYPSLVENVGKAGGLLAIGLGLALANRGRHRAEQALRARSERYQTLSITDGLSRLYNHAFFARELRAQVQRATFESAPLSLVMLDIDDFKQHNDRFGHVEGDRVIRALGRVIRDNIRRSDIAFRYGGEEFTVLLPDTVLEVGAEVAERIREAFAREVFDPPGNEAVSKTVSLGVARLASDEAAQELLKRADMAMFAAKRRGKNRVETAPESAARH